MRILCKKLPKITNKLSNRTFVSIQKNPHVFYRFKALHPQGVLPVDSKLSRGHLLAYQDVKKLKELGYTLVIDLRHSHLSLKVLIERLNCIFFGIDYKRVPFSLLEGIPKKDVFSSIVNKIEHNKGKCLIHCNSGKHRTSLVVAFYSVFKQGKDPKNALKKHVLSAGYMNRRHVKLSLQMLLAHPLNFIKAARNNQIHQALLKGVRDFYKLVKKNCI